MRRAEVFVKGVKVGVLTENIQNQDYLFEYIQDIRVLEVSRTMPVKQKRFQYHEFPPFFDGLLPEGLQLEGLLKLNKIDRSDYFSQLMAVGEDTVGAVTVFEMQP